MRNEVDKHVKQARWSKQSGWKPPVSNDSSSIGLASRISEVPIVFERWDSYYEKIKYALPCRMYQKLRAGSFFESCLRDISELVIDSGSLWRIIGLGGLLSARKAFYIRNYGFPYNETEWLMDSKHRIEYFEKSIDYLEQLNSETVSFIFVLLANDISKLDPDLKIINSCSLAFLADNLWYMLLSMSGARTALKKAISEGKSVEHVVSHDNLWQINDISEIERNTRVVIEENKKQVDEYRSGKTKLFGMFVGKMLRIMPNANPEFVNETLLRLLTNE